MRMDSWEPIPSLFAKTTTTVVGMKMKTMKTYAGRMVGRIDNRGMYQAVPKTLDIHTRPHDGGDIDAKAKGRTIVETAYILTYRSLIRMFRSKQTHRLLWSRTMPSRGRTGPPQVVTHSP
jgi:hypothetical protein